MPLQLRFPICPNLTGRELWLNATLDFCKPPISFLNFKICSPPSPPPPPPIENIALSQLQAKLAHQNNQPPLRTLHLDRFSPFPCQTVRLIPLCSGLSKKTNVCISRFSICIKPYLDEPWLQTTVTALHPVFSSAQNFPSITFPIDLPGLVSREIYLISHIHNGQLKLAIKLCLCRSRSKFGS